MIQEEVVDSERGRGGGNPLAEWAGALLATIELRH